MSESGKSEGVAVAFTHLRKTFQIRRFESLEVLGGVSLALPFGQMSGIMGPSGCGKSTLLYCLAGLELPSSGHVSICGQDLKSLSRTELALLRRRDAGFIFQAYNLIPSMTVKQNLELPFVLRHERARLTRIAIREIRSAPGAWMGLMLLMLVAQAVFATMFSAMNYRSRQLEVSGTNLEEVLSDDALDDIVVAIENNAVWGVIIGVFVVAVAVAAVIGLRKGSLGRLALAGATPIQLWLVTMLQVVAVTFSASVLVLWIPRYTAPAVVAFTADVAGYEHLAAVAPNLVGPAVRG